MSGAPLNIVINNKIYNLNKFADVHPGGRKIIEDFKDTDATDYFYLIHSNVARKQLENLPFTELPEKEKVPMSDYLKLNNQLEKDGWFKPDYKIEIIQNLQTLVWGVLATLLCYDYPFIAAVCLALGIIHGGWIGHSNDHQRDTWLRDVNQFWSIVLIGISPSWWGAKHTLHHLSTNEIAYDSDIQLFPFIYLWKPLKSQDAWNRKFQHIYFTILYSILQLKWQFDGTYTSFYAKPHKGEMLAYAAHWAWYLILLPWKVWFFGTIMGGTIIAWIVTSSHQAEIKLDSKKDLVENFRNKWQIHDMAAHQCKTTVNLDSESWIINLLCGGLQYQIDHHMFPRMPIYRLPLVRPIIKEFCRSHNLPYYEMGWMDIFKRNYDHIEAMAGVKV